MVATYNRPDVLPVALRSVLAQTHQDFRILVIGDGCDDRTDSVIRSLADNRIHYINLPARFGEQSGPNSIGMELADSEFIALLNHDDLYLPDHLERALEQLSVSGADIYFARTAFAFRTKPVSAGCGVLPLFSLVHGKTRNLAEGFWDFNIFEPASAWVFTRRLADSIGPWGSSHQLFRPPLQDWGLRIWRAESQVSFGSEISVLKINTQYRTDSTRDAYFHASEEHPALERWVRETPLAAVRDEITAEIAREQRINTRIRRAIEQMSIHHASSIASYVLRTIQFTIIGLFLNRVTAGIYRKTGLDAFELLCRLAGRHRGSTMNKFSVMRIGKALPEAPSLANVIKQAKLLMDRQP